MQAVILAAGESSRFWPLNQKHKVLFKIMGKSLICYTIESLKRAGIKDLIIVQNPQKDVESEVNRHRFTKLRIKYIIQEKPQGMGSALWQCRNFLRDSFFVLNAERINAGEMIKTLKFKIRDKKCKAVIAGEKTKNPELYGIMQLRGDKIIGIVEKPKKEKAPSNIRVVGAYFLHKEFLDIYKKVKKQKYDFEKSLSLYAKKNDIRAVIIKESPVLKYPWHLFEIEKYIFDKFLKRKIEKTAKIARNVIIEGKVYVGRGVRIFEGAVIKGPCYVGEKSVIGNNCLVREYSNIENNCLLGINSDVARCIFQENIHLHSCFFGDSILSKDCRAAAGTVTGNVRLDRGDIKSKIGSKKINTGRKSFGVVMGENSQIGINVSLMPGILIGSDCLIGPHSLVMENIKDNQIFYSKFQKVIKKNKVK